MTADALTVVQHNKGNEALAPLVLLHDGGGTIYSYHALGPLHRNVYGISNPKFDSEDRAWEGGIPEMAQTYADMIRENVPHGKILLGGWSFGGLLAMELAKLLEFDIDFEVVGLILIDTPYPKSRDGAALKGMNVLPDMPGIRPRVRTKIHKSLQRARSMVAGWELPDFSDDSMTSDGTTSDTSMSSSEDLLGAFEGKPPPAVLLRAANEVDGAPPVRPDQQRRPSKIPLVDVFRQDPALGWNEYDDSFIQVVWDIPGDHFSIFNEEYVKQVTEKLMSACYYLGH